MINSKSGIESQVPVDFCIEIQTNTKIKICMVVSRQVFGCVEGVTVNPVKLILE